MTKARSATAALLLNRCIRTSRSVLTTCERDRMGFPAHVWLWTLLAKMISSTRSWRILVDRRQYWDAKLIARSIYDAMIDVLYILHDPSQRKTLLKLLRIELAVDGYRLVQFEAERRKWNKRTLKYRAGLEEAVREYEWARMQPEYGAKARDWPKRWRSIRAGEKLDAIRSVGVGNWFGPFEYITRHLGDAAAHSRVASLLTFQSKGDDGRRAYTTRQHLPHGFGNPVIMTLDTFTCLLATTAAIVDSFHLGDPHASAIQRLRSDWRAMVHSANGK